MGLYKKLRKPFKIFGTATDIVVDKVTDAIIPNKRIMKKEINAVKKAGKRYNHQVDATQKKAEQLHRVRAGSGRRIIKAVELYVNSLAHSPKSLNKAIVVYNAEYISFDSTIKKIENKVDKAHNSLKSAAGGGALAGASVAAFAPSAAIAFATTFGSASTGAAISTLYGGAAANAALAWLGGGALAAGGGGMAAGNALIAMAGPIGWGIGGIALLGSGYSMNKKCLENTKEAIKARKSIEKHVAALTTTNTKISEHTELTKKHIRGVRGLLKSLKEKAPQDYKQFTPDQKLQAGSLVNHITALSGLLNKVIK